VSDGFELAHDATKAENASGVLSELKTATLPQRSPVAH
jgi:hypothetical protein